MVARLPEALDSQKVRARKFGSIRAQIPYPYNVFNVFWSLAPSYLDIWSPSGIVSHVRILIRSGNLQNFRCVLWLECPSQTSARAGSVPAGGGNRAASTPHCVIPGAE